MNKVKQDIKDIYEKFKKYGSEICYDLLISLISKYLTSLNILNKRSEEEEKYYTITFYINNKEYLLYYQKINNSFIIFDKRKNRTFNNENLLFEYIENKLLTKEV